MSAERPGTAGDNPFQAALLSISVVLIAIGVVTFGIAASKATPSALYPAAAADALPSLIWAGAIIGVGAISFLFWLLVSAMRWKDPTHESRVPLLAEAARASEAA